MYLLEPSVSLDSIFPEVKNFPQLKLKDLSFNNYNYTFSPMYIHKVKHVGIWRNVEPRFYVNDPYVGSGNNFEWWQLARPEFWEIKKVWTGHGTESFVPPRKFGFEFTDQGYDWDGRILILEVLRFFKLTPDTGFVGFLKESSEDLC